MTELVDKLRKLESKGIYFRAGYYGKGEVFTAVLPDGSFLDYYWLDESEDGTVQYIRPTQLRRIINQTLNDYKEYEEKNP